MLTTTHSIDHAVTAVFHCRYPAHSRKQFWFQSVLLYNNFIAASLYTKEVWI